MKGRRVLGSYSHQTGLLAESNGPLSGCPRRRPSLGRWRLNLQPKHNSHTHTILKIKAGELGGGKEGEEKKKEAPTQTKTPTTTLKFKALSPGQQSQSGLEDKEATLQVLDETKHLFGHSTSPVLSPQKATDYKRYPQGKESGSENTSKRFSKAKTLVAAGPASESGRNLHIKMYLKSRVRNCFTFQYSN